MTSREMRDTLLRWEEERERAVDALSALDDDTLSRQMSRRLSRSPENDRFWEAALHPALVERTVLLLSRMIRDSTALNVARAGQPEYDEWRKREARFRNLAANRRDEAKRALSAARPAIREAKGPSAEEQKRAESAKEWRTLAFALVEAAVRDGVLTAEVSTLCHPVTGQPLRAWVADAVANRGAA